MQICIHIKLQIKKQERVIQTSKMSKIVESHVLKEYQLVQQMGSGAYGHVWQVKDKKTGQKLALKKVFGAFRNSIDAQRTYREVEVLYKLNHQNIVKLQRVIKAYNNKDLYLIFEYMEADLHSVVGTSILQKIHQIYIFHQILKAIHYLHLSQLIHRDLKPSNVLINSECLAKLCDFGLIRSLAHPQNEEIILSEEVATKWYRAPQLLLGSRTYGKPVDMWSFGCIIAEVLTGRPLFAGNSTLNQLQKILQYTGELNHIDIQALQSPVAEQLISQIKIRRKNFLEYFDGVDQCFTEILKGLLQLNPNKRLTAEQALQLDLFKQFQNEEIQIARSPIIPAVDDNTRLNIKNYRQKIYDDIDKRYKTLPLKTKLSQNSIQHRSYSKNKERSGSSKKIIDRRSLSTNKIYQKEKSIDKKQQFDKINPYLPKRSSPKVLKNGLGNFREINPLVSKFQVKAHKIVKKVSKNKLNENQKKDILKNLGFQKTKNLYKYIK